MCWPQCSEVVDRFDTAAIYITHDLAVVAQMADRIKVLRYGEEVEEAPTAEDAVQPEAALHQISLGGAVDRKTGGNQRETMCSKSKTSTPAYGTIQVLHDVSISVPRGRRWRWSAKADRASRRPRG